MAASAGANSRAKTRTLAAAATATKLAIAVRSPPIRSLATPPGIRITAASSVNARAVRTPARRMPTPWTAVQYEGSQTVSARKPPNDVKNSATSTHVRETLAASRSEATAFPFGNSS